MDDANALKAARDAVAAKGAEREQMRADWGYHREPEEVLADEVDRLEGANERLRERIAAYEGALEEWEEMDRLIHESSLGTPAAQALIERTPREVGRAIVLGASYVSRAEEAESERNRLRVIARDIWAALWHADPGDVELLSADHEAMLPDVVRAALLAAAQHNNELSNKQNRLQAVVDAVRVMWDNIVGTADEAVMGFPVSDYNAIEAALDRLDARAEVTDG